MADHTTFVRIDGEPFLSRALAYREQREVWREIWGAFCKGRGADGVNASGRALSFKTGRPPEGWTRPERSARISRPKKDHPDLVVMADLRERFPHPDARSVFGNEVAFDIKWGQPDGASGGFGLGGFSMILNGPHLGWAGDVFLGWIPDAEAAARDHLAEHPEHRIVGAAAGWTMPAGLTRLSEAEYALIFAQHKVAEERAASLVGASS